MAYNRQAFLVRYSACAKFVRGFIWASVLEQKLVVVLLINLPRYLALLATMSLLLLDVADCINASVVP